MPDTVDSHLERLHFVSYCNLDDVRFPSSTSCVCSAGEVLDFRVYAGSVAAGVLHPGEWSRAALLSRVTHRHRSRPSMARSTPPTRRCPSLSRSRTTSTSRRGDMLCRLRSLVDWLRPPSTSRCAGWTRGGSSSTVHEVRHQADSQSAGRVGACPRDRSSNRRQHVTATRRNEKAHAQRERRHSSRARRSCCRSLCTRKNRATYVSPILVDEEGDEDRRRRA